MKKAGYKVGIYCINRNIVECKVGYMAMAGWDAKRINRNIVECKGSYSWKGSPVSRY